MKLEDLFLKWDEEGHSINGMNMDDIIIPGDPSNIPIENQCSIFPQYRSEDPSYLIPDSSSREKWEVRKGITSRDIQEFHSIKAILTEAIETNIAFNHMDLMAEAPLIFGH